MLRIIKIKLNNATLAQNLAYIKSSAQSVLCYQLWGGGGGGLVTTSCLTLETPWTATHQALLSMGLPWQGFWNELPFPSPGDVPNSGIEPESPALQVDSLP